MSRIHGISQVGWWDGHAAPTTGPTGTTTTWVGVTAQFTVPGRVFGISMYDGVAAPSAENYTIAVLTPDGGLYPAQTAAVMKLLAPNVAAKWHHLWFHKPIRIATATDYLIAAIYIAGGLYRTNTALAAPVTRNGITFKNSFQLTSLDINGAALVTNTNANAVDVLFQAD